MEYRSEILLGNGKILCLRNGTHEDGPAVYDVFTRTHGETDFLLSYPDENSFTEEQESLFLEKKTADPREIEMVAELDGMIVGTAGIEAVGTKYKVRHRAEFGISILKEYWGLGIGRALTESCIECAKKAGFVQLELNVAAGNARAISLYESLGFKEFGRNPKGFFSRRGYYQSLLYMCLEL